jgi:hypothetical protein
MSGKTANATTKTMRGTLTMKSVIDVVGTVGSGLLLLEVMVTSSDGREVKRT